VVSAETEDVEEVDSVVVEVEVDSVREEVHEEVLAAVEEAEEVEEGDRPVVVSEAVVDEGINLLSLNKLLLEYITLSNDVE
jgi:hypothetical protein